MRTGNVYIEEGISLYYEEYGEGDNIIISMQCGFYPVGMQQYMSKSGYHVYCITMRGFHPSTLIDVDYGEKWYDIFAGDVIAFADKMGIDRFTYMGASHGAGIGWHLMLLNTGRVDAFIAVVAGPHSLAEGTMSYRQMIEQGIIKEVPPFDPPIDNDDKRQKRRAARENWLKNLPEAPEAERKLDYGRPLMKYKNEENLCKALSAIEVPTLLIGGCGDPISKPELLMRTAAQLPHCKLIMYSNCGHNIDTDIIEEVSEEADRFIKNVQECGRVYKTPLM
ncbi:MAG: alpha/beta hydrolase [Clostridia bacterium]|nr:alpha/beta hydrolase [Clostridia bacterium]